MIRRDLERDGRPVALIELFDLSLDPAELHDLSREADGLGRQLNEALVDWSDELERSAPRPEPYELDPDMLDALRALGYLK